MFFYEVEKPSRAMAKKRATLSRKARKENQQLWYFGNYSARFVNAFTVVQNQTHYRAETRRRRESKRFNLWFEVRK
jgi:hypothetical protein